MTDQPQQQAMAVATKAAEEIEHASIHDPGACTVEGMAAIIIAKTGLPGLIEALKEAHDWTAEHEPHSMSPAGYWTRWRTIMDHCDAALAGAGVKL